MAQAIQADNPILQIRQLRRQAAAEIERLISFLDQLGGDPDYEPSEDYEPSLGWTGTEGAYATYRDQPGDDRELDTADDEESDHGEDNGDKEPWLAGRGGDDDREDDNELEQDNADDGHDGGTLSEAYRRRLHARRLEHRPKQLTPVDVPIYIDSAGRAWVGLMPVPESAWVQS